MRSATGPAQHRDGPAVWRRSLPARTESIPTARRFVSEALTTLDAVACRDDVVALVSELATNAVIHARTDYSIDVRREGDIIRVGVQDHSPVLPRRRAYGVDATTGRGLRLVATMSSSWGVDAVSGGKVVWFEMACDGGQAPLGWYTDVDVDALLSAFDDADVDARSSQPRR